MRVATFNLIQFLQPKSISIHATHAGGDISSHPGCAVHVNFNPRHPCGWRLPWSAILFLPLEFQSTPPMRVATNIIDEYLKVQEFQSTPPMRVATLPSCLPPRLLLFQSTPPMRVATGNLFLRVLLAEFQSTPPMRVATGHHRRLETVLRISIHATHAGGDVLGSLVPPKTVSFQSTPPMRVATALGKSRTFRRIFQSTPPMRVATAAFDCAVWVHLNFNPRHPCGWRPSRCFSSTTRPLISIHATHAGGDIRTRTDGKCKSYFNPRHPCGWRQSRAKEA